MSTADDISPPESADDLDGCAAVFIDASCLLCLRSVKILFRLDRRHRLRYGALGSKTFERMAAATANAPASMPDSVVVIDGGRVHVESDALLAIARRLGFPYSLAGVFRLLPRAIRDGLYRSVARNRYRWFGRVDQGPDHCPVPTPEERARLLPDDDALERRSSQ